MKMLLMVMLALVLFTSLIPATTFAKDDLEAVIEVQTYNRAIHIMAMLLIGFGFLMVFVRGYGLSALTATYLMVAVAIPGYFLLKTSGWFGHAVTGVEGLVLTEFAAASLLICAGAVLGRLKMWQYLMLAVLFLPAYMLNEWILLEGGWGLVAHGAFVDTGGSIVIHAFGAMFGLGVAVSMTTRREQDLPVASDATSDRFSLLGSMVLWVFWPSFCAALVAPEMIPTTVMNVVFALCGSTLLTYLATVLLRREIDAADIANATLAGGVAIGSTCDQVSLPVAFLIGAIAGFISTFGFAVIQDKLQKGLRLVDTCGVSNLHGIPGVFGGLAAMIFVGGIDYAAQGLGIAVTVVVAVVAGLIAGRVMAMTGHREQPYDDSEEFSG
ncbi:MAG: ammonium transporter [Candidatus Krumholzibacteria bacterium]|nr:ammonium transporter [Candidatus Krumholzibacteria bacterium]